MKEANITTLNGNKFCKIYDDTDWDIQICAGNLKFSSNECRGMAGGPLFIFEKGKTVLAGIISYGSSCDGRFLIFLKL